MWNSELFEGFNTYNTRLGILNNIKSLKHNKHYCNCVIVPINLVAFIYNYIVLWHWHVLQYLIVETKQLLDCFIQTRIP